MNITIKFDKEATDSVTRIADALGEIAQVLKHFEPYKNVDTDKPTTQISEEKPKSPDVPDDIDLGKRAIELCIQCFKSLGQEKTTAIVGEYVVARGYAKISELPTPEAFDLICALEKELDGDF